MPRLKRIIYCPDDPEGVVCQDKHNPKWKGEESVQPLPVNAMQNRLLPFTDHQEQARRARIQPQQAMTQRFGLFIAVSEGATKKKTS